MAYELKTVGNAIQGMSSKDAAKYKSSEMSKVVKRNFNGIEVEKVLYDQERLKVIIKGAGKANPFYFQNPPLLVPDGTKSIEIDSEGNEIEVDNFTEDLEKAFEHIVTQAYNTTKK